MSEEHLTPAAFAEKVLYGFDPSALRRALLPPAPRTSPWIPRAERLPEEMEWVLVSYCEPGVPSFRMIARTEGGKWWSDDFSIYANEYITHWMPLPEGP